MYVPGGSATEKRLVWVNRSGEARELSTRRNSYRHPRLSPDGLRLAIRIGDYGGAAHVWLQDVARDTLTRLTFEGRNVRPIWTPDGRFVTVGTGSPTTGGLSSISADGSGIIEKVFERGRPTSWSPDGRTLAVTDYDIDTDILLVTGGDVQPFAATDFNESQAEFSPDGGFIAYVSDESGDAEVYVRPYPGSGGKLQISSGGGTEVAWRRDGREIFYRSGPKLMSVPIQTTPELRAEAPELLFEGPFMLALDADRRNYDVSLDGSEFVMIESERNPELTQLNVILNWTRELERVLDNQ